MAAMSSELERETTDIIATSIQRFGTNSSVVREMHDKIHVMK